MDTVRIRPDFERIRAARGESRSAERLTAHYEVEHELAQKLAHSSPAERSSLYADLYRQLFESVADHPQHAGGRASRVEQIRAQAATLLGWMRSDATYVEIGCGDAALTKAVAASVREAIGVDVTPMLVTAEAPPAFRFLRSDGVNLDLPTGSADLVYSNQLMEHLHEEDAAAQLREIARILKPGGRYICATPNRLTGPHDISIYFGHEPAGFHMREYDHRSLARLFRAAGFATARAMVTAKGRRFMVPVGLMGAVEACLEILPAALRANLALLGPVSNLLGVTLVGTR